MYLVNYLSTIALGLFFLAFIILKRKVEKKRELVIELQDTLATMTKLEEERKSLYLKYLLDTYGLKFVTVRIDKEVKKLNVLCQKQAGRAFSFFEPKVRNFWRIWVKIFYRGKKEVVRQRFAKQFRPTRQSLKNLEISLASLRELIEMQNDLTKLLQDATEETIFGAGGELITKTLWYHTMESSKRSKWQLRQAKVDVGEAFEYAKRKSARGIPTGNLPFLEFESVEEYYLNSLAKIAEMDNEEPETLFDYCKAVVANLVSGFDRRATSIRNLVDRYNRGLALLEKLSENVGLPVTACDQITGNLESLIEEIGEDWKDPKNWGRLQSHLEEANTLADKLEQQVEKLAYWGEQILRLRDLAKSSTNEAIPRDRVHETIENVSVLWARGDRDFMEAFRAVEESLSYADDEATETDEEILSQPESLAPTRPTIGGKRIKVLTKAGVVEIDSSLANLYR